MKRKMFDYVKIKDWLWERCYNASERHDWDMYHQWQKLFHDLPSEYVTIVKRMLQS